MQDLILDAREGFCDAEDFEPVPDIRDWRDVLEDVEDACRCARRGGSLVNAIAQVSAAGNSLAIAHNLIVQALRPITGNLSRG